MRSIVRISKLIVNINLIIMFNPNIYLFSRAFFFFFFFFFFFGAVVGGSLHFYSGFTINDMGGLKFLYDYYGLRIGKPSPGQKGHPAGWNKHISAATGHKVI